MSANITGLLSLVWCQWNNVWRGDTFNVIFTCFHVLPHTCSEPHPLARVGTHKYQTMPSKLWTRNSTIPCLSYDPNFPNLTWNLDGSLFLFIVTFNLSYMVQNVILQHKSSEEAVNPGFQCMTSLQLTHPCGVNCL